MERRRKALGLRKLYSNGEEKTTSANEKNETEGKRSQMHQKSNITPRNSKALKDMGTSKGNVSPKQTTPKNHQVLLKAESPASPLISPSQNAMVMHKMFGSPEVEVSWDWGCSQVVNEIVPVRRLTRANQSQPVPVPDSVTLSYPRLPPNKQMSEEENQERLAFYKDILSKSLKGNQKDFTKNNNNIEEENKADQNSNNTTPKRRPDHTIETAKKDQVNAFFDDSANEFMLECSQAIEEQLQNGEILIGSVINIEIGSKKHPLSPVVESENAAKKICNGKTKQNLFPDSTKSPKNNHNKKQHLSLKSPKVKPSTINSCSETSLCSNDIKRTIKNNNDVLFVRPVQTSRSPMVKAVSEKESSKVIKNGQLYIPNLASNDKDTTVLRPNSKKECASDDKVGGNISVQNSSRHVTNRLLEQNKFVTGGNHTNGKGNTLHYDSVNKFRRSQNGDFSKKHLNLHEPQSCNTTVKKTVNANSTCKASLKKENSVDNNVKRAPNLTSEGLVKVTKPKGVDVTPLLDDGFDMDLCSLDFDSLCCNSQQGQPKETQREPVIENVPKVCSEQEIEAKRIAALNRLMMKKKK